MARKKVLMEFLFLYALNFVEMFAHLDKLGNSWLILKTICCKKKVNSICRTHS